jgi:hypothetical protein
MAAKVAIHTRWSNTGDRAAATAPARRGFRARFERQVDPEGLLAADERERRIDHAIAAYMTRLALNRENAKREKRASRGLPVAA